MKISLVVLILLLNMHARNPFCFEHDCDGSVLARGKLKLHDTTKEFETKVYKDKLSYKRVNKKPFNLEQVEGLGG